MTSATAISITRINERYEGMKRDCRARTLRRPILEFNEHIHRDYRRLLRYDYKKTYIGIRIDRRNMWFDYWNDLYDDDGENPTATSHHEPEIRMLNQQWHEIRGIPPGTDHDF